MENLSGKELLEDRDEEENSFNESEKKEEDTETQISASEDVENIFDTMQQGVGSIP